MRTIFILRDDKLSVLRGRLEYSVRTFRTLYPEKFLKIFKKFEGREGGILFAKDSFCE